MGLNNASQEGSGERPLILVVDDNPMNLDLMVEILKDDYRLQVAISGEQALNIVRTSPPDLILLDIMMPGMDGYEVCQRLKSDESTRRIPIIFVTAKSQVEDEAKGLACGAVDYLTKPISPAIVLARAKTHIALYDQNRALEEQVLKKTRQWMASKEMAEKASEAKSSFLNNISHELRTPLNHVNGLTQLLAEIIEGEEQVELINHVSKSALSLTSLFNQLLDLNTLEADAFVLEQEIFDLKQFSESRAVVFDQLARRKGLAFSADIGADVPTMVEGAPYALGQVLTNVMTNACRFTEKGEVGLIVRVDRDRFSGLEASEIRIRFIVEDTGVGIPEEKQATIFAGFEIGEKVLTKRLSGVGVGLTIAKLLVDKMRGDIWVESEVDKGSRFHISLPFTRKSAE